MILERRRAFIAAAVASIGAVSGCEEKPRVCLAAVSDETRAKPTPTPPEPADAGVLTPPMVCLSEPAHRPDAGPRPVPCLSIAAPSDAGPKPPATPRPKACLTVLPDM